METQTNTKHKATKYPTNMVFLQNLHESIAEMFLHKKYITEI